MKCNDCLVGLYPIPSEGDETVFLSDFIKGFYHLPNILFFDYCPYCGSRIVIKNHIVYIKEIERSSEENEMY